jgi:hypothetical protein
VEEHGRATTNRLEGERAAEAIYRIGARVAKVRAGGIRSAIRAVSGERANREGVGMAGMHWPQLSLKGRRGFLRAVMVLVALATVAGAGAATVISETTWGEVGREHVPHRVHDQLRPVRAGQRLRGQVHARGVAQLAADLRRAGGLLARPGERGGRGGGRLRLRGRPDGSRWKPSATPTHTLALLRAVATGSLRRHRPSNRRCRGSLRQKLSREEPLLGNGLAASRSARGAPCSDRVLRLRGASHRNSVV